MKPTFILSAPRIPSPAAPAAGLSKAGSIPGFAVRVRLGNCIPQLRRFALRACSAGGRAVSLPSSGCDGALTRLENKGRQALVRVAPVIFSAAGAERRSHIAAARPRKRVRRFKKPCKPDAPKSLNIAAFLTVLKENCSRIDRHFFHPAAFLQVPQRKRQLFDAGLY